VLVCNVRKKPVIGILGGIGSGKTSVAAEFAKLGCAVINADRIVHKLLETGDIKGKLLAAFGETVFDREGKIDRVRLAEVVFAKGEKLGQLNDIIHGDVLRRVEELIARYNRQKNIPAVVLDMPLLAEVGWDKRCDKLIFVDCDEENRLRRAKNRGIDENQLKIRENFQISLDKKAKLAHYKVDSNSGLSALVKQVADVFSCIVNSG